MGREVLGRRGAWGLGCRAEGVELKAKDEGSSIYPGPWTLGPGPWTLDAEPWILDPGLYTLDPGP